MAKFVAPLISPAAPQMAIDAGVGCRSGGVLTTNDLSAPSTSSAPTNPTHPHR
jgi:hypothetical protein